MRNDKYGRADVERASAKMAEAIDATWAITVVAGESMSRQQSMLERLVEIRKEFALLDKELRDA